MKNRSLVMIIFAAFGCFVMTSYKDGPAANDWDCTGAETGLSNPTGCSRGSNGCHSNNVSTFITVSLELDSAGVPVTQYVAGMTYNVKLTGTNTGTTLYPKFGFQIGCIRGSSAVTTPTPEGTWPAPFPANTHLVPPSAGNFVVSLVEHTAPHLPTTGNGGNGSTFAASFLWTAPAAGTGIVSFWSAINLVNGNDTGDTGDKWNIKHIIIDENLNNGIESVKNENAFALKVTNPIQNRTLYLTMKSSKSVYLEGDLYSQNGMFIQHVFNDKLPAGNTQTTIHLSDDLSTGLYLLFFRSGNDVISKKVVVL